MGVEQFAWTDTTVERLRTLWADGDTCSQIAGVLGCTRNAVIGKVHRLGLSGRIQRMSPEARLAKERARDAARSSYKRLQRMDYAAIRAAKAAAQNGWFQPSPPEEPPIGQRCTLMQLTSDTCRFPIGHPTEPDFAFCGGMSEEGKPYCGPHMRFTHQPRWVRA